MGTFFCNLGAIWKGRTFFKTQTFFVRTTLKVRTLRGVPMKALLLKVRTILKREEGHIFLESEGILKTVSKK